MEPEPRSDDAFGFTALADRMARTVSSPELSASVLALTGRWGSGKTWVIGELRQSLRRQPSRVVVLEISAWEFADSADLTSAFLAEFGSQLKERSWFEQWWNLWRRYQLRRIGRRLRGYGAAFAAIADAALPLAVKWGRALRLFFTPPSIAKRRERVRRALASAPGRILVVVDDVDRLEGGELMTLLKLLRSVGDLPNVVFLVACDPRAVAIALPEELGSIAQRSDYLQKFFELRWAVPQISANDTLSFMAKEISKRVERWEGWSREVGFSFDVFSGPDYGRIISTPRAAIRTAEQLAVLPEDVLADLDLGDLVYLEAVRVSRADVWGQAETMVRQIGASQWRERWGIDNVNKPWEDLHAEARKAIVDWDDLSPSLERVLTFLAESGEARRAEATRRTSSDDERVQGRLSDFGNASAYFRAARGEERLSPDAARTFAAQLRSRIQLDAAVRKIPAFGHIDIPNIVLRVWGADPAAAEPLGTILAALPADLDPRASEQWSFVIADYIRATRDAEAACSMVTNWLRVISGMGWTYRAVAEGVARASIDQGDPSSVVNALPALRSDLNARVASALSSHREEARGLDDALRGFELHEVRAFWDGADPRLFAYLLTDWFEERERAGVPFGGGRGASGYLPAGYLQDWFGESLAERLREARLLGLRDEIAAEAVRVTTTTDDD